MFVIDFCCNYLLDNVKLFVCQKKLMLFFFILFFYISLTAVLCTLGAGTRENLHFRLCFKFVYVIFRGPTKWSLFLMPCMVCCSGAHQHPSTHRPRLLLAGEPGQAQSTHLGPAVLHHLERLPAHVLDLPALFAATTTTPEESCAQVRHTCHHHVILCTIRPSPNMLSNCQLKLLPQFSFSLVLF